MLIPEDTPRCLGWGTAAYMIGVRGHSDNGSKLNQAIMTIAPSTIVRVWWYERYTFCGASQANRPTYTGRWLDWQWWAVLGRHDNFVMRKCFGRSCKTPYIGVYTCVCVCVTCVCAIYYLSCVRADVNMVCL